MSKSVQIGGVGKNPRIDKINRVTGLSSSEISFSQLIKEMVLPPKQDTKKHPITSLCFKSDPQVIKPEIKSAALDQNCSIKTKNTRGKVEAVPFGLHSIEKNMAKRSI